MVCSRSTAVLLATVVVACGRGGFIADRSPVAENIAPPAFDEDTESIIGLAYSDADGDLASGCSVSDLTDVVESRSCACVAGICTVGVTGTPNFHGTAGFDLQVEVNGKLSNPARATLTILPVDDGPLTTRLWDERFETDPGYDRFSHWTEDVGINCEVDEDADPADVGTPLGWGGQCLRLVLAPPDSYGSVGYWADVPYPRAYVYLEVVIASENMADGERVSFLDTWDATLVDTHRVGLMKNAGELLFRIEVARRTSPGSNSFESGPVTTGTLYRIEVRWDAPADEWEWRINGENQPNDVDGSIPATSPGTLIDEHRTDVAKWRLGVPSYQANRGSATVYMDNFVVDTVDWVQPPPMTRNTQGRMTLNYHNPDDEPATTCHVTNPLHVTVDQPCGCSAGTCSVLLTPEADYTGPASFEYTVTAGAETTTLATEMFTVVP